MGRPSVGAPPAWLARLKVFILGAALLGGLLLAGLILWSGLGPSDLLAGIEWTVDFLADHPVLLFLGIALLPAIGFPVSILCVVGGAVFGREHGILIGAGICVLGVWVNVIWMYFLSAYPMREIVSRMLAYLGYTIPVLSNKQGFRLTLVIRFTPGVPLMIQNYLLGVVRIPFKNYWPISLFQQGLYCGAIAITGGSLLEGNSAYVIAAIGFLVVVGVALQIVREKMKKQGLKSEIAG